MCVIQYIDFNSTKAQIERDERNYYHLLQNMIENKMTNQLDIAKMSIISIANNPVVARTFAERDREEFLRITGPVFQDLKENGVAQFQFHLPEFKV